jgi:hypothetical protein
VCGPRASPSRGVPWAIHPSPLNKVLTFPGNSPDNTIRPERPTLFSRGRENKEGTDMIEETIKKIENRIKESSSGGQAGDKNMEELVVLLETLRSEVAELSKTDAEHAESIAGFAKVSAHEATRRDQNPELLKLSVKGLASSVEGIESSHPRVVEVVNRISVMLSNMGI